MWMIGSRHPRRVIFRRYGIVARVNDKPSLPAARDIIGKTIVTHTVTYFVAGVTAFFLFDYPTLVAETTLGAGMRPLDHPLVLGGPLLQPVRGVLFGLVFYILREPFFSTSRGWLRIWMVLAGIGILGTFGAPPGSLEGVIYTVLPIWIHFMLLAEVLVQSLVLSWLVFQWVNRPRRWITWVMSTAFLVVLFLSVGAFLSNAAT
jgi:hypothetical protein